MVVMGRRNYNDIDISKKTILIGSFLLIIFFFVIFYFELNYENYRFMKIDKNKHIVYTRYESKAGNYSIQIPTINLKGKTISSINEEIDSITQPFLQEKNVIIHYEYDINGNILSLIIKIMDFDKERYLEPVFKSYHIRLDSLRFISNDELLKYFHVNEEYVSLQLEKQFQMYYENILEDNYYDKEQQLFVYRPFIYTSIFGEEHFFKEDDFAIKIVSLES